jgi:hypothetical protein
MPIVMARCLKTLVEDLGPGDDLQKRITDEAPLKPGGPFVRY